MKFSPFQFAFDQIKVIQNNIKIVSTRQPTDYSSEYASCHVNAMKNWIALQQIMSQIVSAQASTPR